MKKLITACLLANILFSIGTPALAYDLDDIVEIKYRKAIDAGCPHIKAKDPSLAGVLGFLPGGGSFYTGAIGVGILDVITWPFSVLWDVPTSATRAHNRNKFVTVEMCKEKGKIKSGELDVL